MEKSITGFKCFAVPPYMEMGLPIIWTISFRIVGSPPVNRIFRTPCSTNRRAMYKISSLVSNFDRSVNWTPSAGIQYWPWNFCKWTKQKRHTFIIMLMINNNNNIMSILEFEHIHSRPVCLMFALAFMFCCCCCCTLISTHWLVMLNSVHTTAWMWVCACACVCEWVRWLLFIIQSNTTTHVSMCVYILEWNQWEKKTQCMACCIRLSMYILCVRHCLYIYICTHMHMVEYTHTCVIHTHIQLSKSLEAAVTTTSIYTFIHPNVIVVINIYFFHYIFFCYTAPIVVWHLHRRLQRSVNEMRK